ncbi:MAG: hypothetical protein QOE70_6255 [Chthoniobacter sp.]|jgi:hypothetical protein|nr:hypothetical protein [Chthoniobacter sp.]
MNIRLIAALTSLVVSVFVTAANAATFTVFKATAYLPGYIQQGTAGAPKLKMARLATADLINLALGQPLLTLFPDTYVLAAAIGDDNTGRFIVFDTKVLRVVATLGTVGDRRRAENNPEALVDFRRVGTGNIAFGQAGSITGGNLRYAGIMIVQQSDRPGPFLNSRSEVAIGSISYVTGGVPSEIIIIHGKLTIDGKSLGTFTSP